MTQKLSKIDFRDLVQSELNAYNATAEPDDRVNLGEWLTMNGEFYYNEYGYYYSEIHECYVYDILHDRFIMEEV